MRDLALALLILFLAFQIADGLTSWAVLSDGGMERNPLLCWFTGCVGVGWGLMVAKVTASMAGIYVYYRATHEQAVWILGAAVVYYSAIVGHNLAGLMY